MPFQSYEHLATNVAKLMKARDITSFSQLSKMTGIATSTLTRWMSRTTTPNGSTFSDFCGKLGLKSEQLIAPSFNPSTVVRWAPPSTEPQGAAVQFECPSKWQFRDHWQDLRTRLSKHYLMYTKWRGDKNIVKISLFSIGSLTSDGIAATLYRPTAGVNDGDIVVNKYSGIIFPVGDFVQGVAQRDGGVGIASLLFNNISGHINNVGGVIIGPSLRAGQHRVSAYDFYIVETDKNASSLEAVRKILAIENLNKIPTAVRKFLDEASTH